MKEDTEPVYTLVTDYTNEPLTDTLQVIAGAYSGLVVTRSECGYACSDHASWTKAGVPSAFAMEAAMDVTSKAIHTTQDTVSSLSIAHVAAFAKVAVGFAVELSLHTA